MVYECKARKNENGNNKNQMHVGYANDHTNRTTTTGIEVKQQRPYHHPHNVLLKEWHNWGKG